MPEGKEKKRKKSKKIKFEGKRVRYSTLFLFALVYATIYAFLYGLSDYYLGGTILIFGVIPFPLLEFIEIFFGIIFPIVFATYLLFASSKKKYN